LLALKYYDLYTTKRDWFLPRYVALLKNGFDKPPAEMLHQFLEIDFTGSELLKGDLDLLGRRLDQLEVTLDGKK
jgi:oligoendopeptidase F